MHIPQILTSTVLAASLLACSNSVVEPPSLVEASASYQLELTDGAIDWGDFPPYASDPSIGGLEARLDFALDEDGAVRAWVTRPFGSPVEYTGTFEDGELTLLPTEYGASLGDVTLDTVELRGEVRDGVVRVATDCHASGSISVFEGDVGWVGELEADATIRPDDVAPEISVRADTAFPELTPWTTVTVDVSEPVLMDELVEALAVDVDYEMEPRATMLDDLIVALTLSPNGWWPESPLGVELAAGIADPAGNESAAVSRELARFDSPAPTAMIDFESPESSEVDAWGLAEDPSVMDCASGAGCLVLTSDGGGSAGLYGRLDGEVSTLSFRVKAREIDSSSYGTLMLTVNVEVGGADGGPVHRFSELVSASGAEEPAPLETEWMELELALPETVSSPGVAIEISNPYGGGYGGPPLLVSPAYIAIDELQGL